MLTINGPAPFATETNKNPTKNRRYASKKKTKKEKKVKEDTERVAPVSNNFRDCDEYKMIFEPLFLEEIRVEIVQWLEELKQMAPKIKSSKTMQTNNYNKHKNYEEYNNNSHHNCKQNTYKICHTESPPSTIDKCKSIDVLIAHDKYSAHKNECFADVFDSTLVLLFSPPKFKNQKKKKQFFCCKFGME